MMNRSANYAGAMGGGKKKGKGKAALPPQMGGKAKAMPMMPRKPKGRGRK